MFVEDHLKISDIRLFFIYFFRYDQRNCNEIRKCFLEHFFNWVLVYYSTFSRYSAKGVKAISNNKITSEKPPLTSM